MDVNFAMHPKMPLCFAGQLLRKSVAGLSCQVFGFQAKKSTVGPFGVDLDAICSPNCLAASGAQRKNVLFV